jgi:hypothetical protein
MLPDMRPGQRVDLEPWLTAAKRLPFVRSVEVRGKDATRSLHLRARGKDVRYRLEVSLAQPLGRAQLASLLAPRRRQSERVLLFAPQVSGGLAEALREAGIDYVDLAGNCHIDVDGVHVAHVEGRKLRERFVVEGEHKREAHYRVYFALAVRPELASATVREIARETGAGKSTVDRTLARLEADGILAITKTKRHVLRRDQLMDRWIAGYVEHLQQRWTVSRYQPQEKDPEKLVETLTRVLEGKTWGLGGSAGGWRLDRHYRGEETVVHLATPEPDLPRQVRALPAREGPLRVLVTPMPLAFATPVADTVHPLLVYGDLVASNDERAIEAAGHIRQRYLKATG